MSSVVPQLQLLALSIVAARYLGPEGTGRQSFIAFAALSLVLVASSGPAASLCRFVGELIGARSWDVALGLYRWTWRLEVAAAVLAAGGLAAVGAFGAEPAAAWALAGVGGGFAILSSVPGALLLGAQRWRDATIVGLITGVASVPAAIAVLEAGGGVTGFFAVETAILLLNLLGTAALARRLTVRQPSPAALSASLRSRFVYFAGASTGIVVIEFVVSRRSELFFLAGYSSETQIALYSIAFAAASGLGRIPEVVARITMPVASNLVGSGRLDSARSGFWRALRLLVFALPPLVAGALVIGPASLRLVYGAGFAGAGDVLRILLVPLIVLPLVTTAEAMLFALGRVRFLVAAGLVGCVVNVTLAFVLIPPFDAVGAAYASSFAQLTAGLPALYLAWRLLGPAELAWTRAVRGLGLAALTAAAAGAVLAGLGSGAGGVTLAVLAGVLTFAVLGPALRPLTGDDAEWLVAALGLDTGARLAKLLTRFAAQLA